MDDSYLAGIMDGEGSIMLPHRGRGYHVVTVSISNTYEPLIRLIHEREGGSFYTRSNQSIYSKPLYAWHLRGRATLPLLRRLHPFLIVKREQAGLAIEFLELPSGWGTKMLPDTFARRAELVERCAELNKRGTRQ